MATDDLAFLTSDSRAPSLRLDCPVLETERLLLRAPHAEDMDDLVRLADNPAVATMLASMPSPYTSEDARQFMERFAWNKRGNCVYAATAGETGRFMGIFSLHENSERYELPFLGYWLGEPFWGAGYATEAARALVDLYFRATANDRMMAACRIDNERSRRVIEKCGGRYWKRGFEMNRALGMTVPVDHYVFDRPTWLATASAA